MTDILIVKTSSLGDVVHNLPVVSDIRRAFPDAAVDWVVEESYEFLPRLHPGVRAVLPVNVRRWRASWWCRDTREQIRSFKARVRRQRYDAIIDTQGLFKSALLTRLARGPRYGLDWTSAREPLGWLYDRTFRVPWHLHAVERNRELAALALRYPRSPEVDYGIAAQPAPHDSRYAVLLHATSAKAKLWPEAGWIDVAAWLAQHGLRVVLPWGDTEEQRRSLQLAAAMENASVPERLSLERVTRELAGASLVIGLDTGLTHLAGALGVPTIGLYVATDPAATGLHAGPRAVNLGAVSGAPASSEVVRAAAQLLGLS